MSIKKRESDKTARKAKKPSSFARSSVGKPLTLDAGIFKIIGIGESKKPGGYSTCKHELDL